MSERRLSVDSAWRDRSSRRSRNRSECFEGTFVARANVHRLSEFFMKGGDGGEHISALWANF